MSSETNIAGKIDGDHFKTQWLVGLSASLSTLMLGLANGWSSPYLAKLSSAESEENLRLTDFEVSWIGSLLNLGRTVGCAIGAIVQVYTGRKRSLLLSGLISMFGWVCITSESITSLFFARLLLGISNGVIWTSISLYLGEIANPRIRGSLISWNINMSLVGLFLGNVMGPYLPMYLFACVSLVPNMLFITAFCFMPETPHYYILRGDIARAEKSLKWLRRKKDVTKELRELEEYTKTSSTSFFEHLREFKNPDNLRGIFILFCLNVFAYISGNNPINTYMEILITNCKTNLTPSTVVMVLSFCPIVAGFTGTILIDIFGRRKLLYISAIGTSLALFLLGLHFHLLFSNVEPQKLSWLPILAFFTFLVSYHYGLGQIPTTLVSEMFPQSIKVAASFLYSESSALFAFLSALTFLPFHALVGENYAYWICSACVSLVVPFTYFFIKETKGKSLLEIQKARSKV